MSSGVKSVYLFCRPDSRAYQDDIVVLAQGLQSLGIGVHGNCDYWQDDVNGPFLVKHDPSIRPEDCDVVAVTYIWPRWMDSEFRTHEKALPQVVKQGNRNFVSVYMDLEDGYESMGFRDEFRCFDHVLRAKFNRRCFHPPNHRPWALGLTGRVLRSLPSQPMAFAERKREVLVNFGASHPFAHGTRSLFTGPFVEAIGSRMEINTGKDDLSLSPEDPWDALMWRQTQLRHAKAYYERLANSQAVAAFCGEMIPPAPLRPSYLVGGGRAELKRRLYDILSRFDPRGPRSIQWDSWRFWEGLAAGCLVFNVDLDYYGVRIPVMPVNGKHYVGLRLDRISEGVDEILSNPEKMEAIAREGRVWAMEHYSPIGLAKQFLEIVGTGSSSMAGGRDRNDS